jgi:RNA polymerase sigma factor for flagellar operon FliA
VSIDLLEAYRSGAPHSADELVRTHLPLVKRVVGRLAIQLPPNVGREDLEEIGILGLLNAAKNYDPTRGASFRTFAFIAIQGAVLDELRRLDVLPRTRRDGVKAYEEARTTLTERVGREPTFLEIQQELGLTPMELEEVLRARSLAESHARGLGEASTGVDPHSFTSDGADDPAAQAQVNEAKELLAAAIATLPRREQEVVLCYYHGGLLLKEIGQVLEITESRVSQILQHALVLLNHKLGRKFED